MKVHNPLFDYYPAEGNFIGLISIPHSGEELPEEFKPYLIKNFQDLAQDVDYRVHELINIASLNAAGIGVLKAHIIRTAIDLNRSKETALLNWKQNSKGIKIVTQEPNSEQAQRLVEKYYTPYYEFLRTLIEELKNSFDHPSIVDLHSMPSRAEEYHLKINPNQPLKRPSFCLSDYHGKTCSPEYIKFFQSQLKQTYEDVTINQPYVGGHITQYIDQEFPETNNIQIEISRGIYMDEETKGLTDTEKLKQSLTQALKAGFKKFS